MENSTDIIDGEVAPDMDVPPAWGDVNVRSGRDLPTGLKVRWNVARRLTSIWQMSLRVKGFQAKAERCQGMPRETRSGWRGVSSRVCRKRPLPGIEMAVCVVDWVADGVTNWAECVCVPHGMGFGSGGGGG